MIDKETQQIIEELTKRLETLSFQQENTNKEIYRAKEAVVKLI